MFWCDIGSLVGKGRPMNIDTPRIGIVVGGVPGEGSVDVRIVANARVMLANRATTLLERAMLKPSWEAAQGSMPKVVLL